MSKLPVDFIAAEESLINKNMIREVHKLAKQFLPGSGTMTIRQKDYWSWVDGIITDYPVAMIKIRDKYKDYK